MSVTGLHPEHLLDRERDGALDDAGRAQLEAHLTTCAACRFERLARADFAAELEGEEPRVSVSEALTHAPAPAKKKRKPWRAWTLMAAALLVVATAVASERALFVEATPAPRATASVVMTVHDPPPVVAPPPPRAEPEPTVTVVTPVVIVSSPSAPPPPAEDARALFEHETDARRRGDYERVISLHSALVTRFPRSREAQVSRATVARMLLDRGEDASALVGFDAYLAHGGGELAGEARFGRATALEHLGRTSEALSAWQALADDGGPYAARARARIEALRQAP